MANSVATNILERFSQWFNNSSMSPGRAGLYEKVLEYIESHQLNPRSVLAWFRDTGFELGNVRAPRFENWHFESQAGANGAITTAAVTTSPLVETPLSVPDQWGFMESNPRLGNGLADFSFNFDAWRLPESNEIPRQGLRTDLDYEMQNLIQAMGSFKACREQRIAADGPAGAPCQA